MSTHQLDDKVNLGIVDDAQPVVGEHAVGDGERPWLVEVPHGHPLHAEVKTRLGSDGCVVVYEASNEGAANRSGPQDANSDR